MPLELTEIAGGKAVQRIASLNALQDHAYAEAFQSGFGATRLFFIYRGVPAEAAGAMPEADWTPGWDAP